MSANPSCSATGASGGAGSGSGSSGGGGGGGPCGACKFLRRKCVAGCIFAPYFDSEQGAAHFAAVHKVFGASNASKLLLHIPVHKRLDAVVTICYEAQARLRDPVYGCVAHIFALQQQVVNLQAELSYLQAHLATMELPTPPPQPQSLLLPPPLSISDLPTCSSVPATYDLSALFDPIIQPAGWAAVQQMDPRHFLPGVARPSPTPAADQMSPSSSCHHRGGVGGDLQELGREYLQRPPPDGTVPCTEGSSLHQPPPPPRQQSK